jgi:hypothetical protein
MDDIASLTGLLHFPHPNGIRPVFADIEGPAFFPGGTGVVAESRAGRDLPRGGILVLGHNFNTESSYERTKRRGREDDTNQNLARPQELFARLRHRSCRLLLH